MTQNSQRTRYSKNFLPLIWRLWILQMPGKTDCWKNISRLSFGIATLPGHRKDNGKWFLLDQVHVCSFLNSKYGCRANRIPGKVTNTRVCMCVCVFGFWFCPLCSLLTKWLLPLLLGSCLIQPWTILFCFRTILTVWWVSGLHKKQLHDYIKILTCAPETNTIMQVNYSLIIK